MKTRLGTRWAARCVAGALITALPALTAAQWVEAPSSETHALAMGDPVLRVPFMRRPPVIDGDFSETEWEDASSVTAFWGSNVPNRPYPAYEHLAPHQIQSRVYVGYDAEHLYMAYLVDIYPENAWLKARGRFPNVYGHPLYGIMRDDHIEFEMRPYNDLAQAYGWGFFKWFVNPLGTVSDQFLTQRGGEGIEWSSEATVRVGEHGTYWVVEMKVPFAPMKTGDYAGTDAAGNEIMPLPVPDGAAYRNWWKNGIGGAGRYVVLYDQHTWRATKNILVFDSQAVSCQVNHVGPVMEDVIDVTLTLKNNTPRSETVRVGFFVENAEGVIYSSYEDPNTQEGMIELVPGEVKRLNFRRRFPGISRQNNFLWFDVRTAGRPGKILLQNRLAEFHSTDPGPPFHDWQRHKLDSIAGMRPPRMDFWFRFQYSPYNNRVSAIVDRGLREASDEAKSAVEAKLTIVNAVTDAIVLDRIFPFAGDFATLLADLPDDLPEGEYRATLLLFDANKRIVGERAPDPFTIRSFPWENNTLGLEDIVWWPFEPLQVAEGDNGLTIDTIKQTLSIEPSGLPEQIAIKPDPRELPLERRAAPETATAAELREIGRGPQFRAPMRFEAVVDGQRVAAEVIEPARVTRRWDSELELTSKLRVGPVEIDLVSQYDCDGTMTFTMTYGADAPAIIELLELVMDVDGPVDMRTGGGYHMTPNSGLEMTLEDGEGVLWDSANPRHMATFELYYSRFCPYLFFGNGDRGWTWIADSDEPWLLDRDGSAMTLERDRDGQVTWRAKFVNHETDVSGRRTTEFVIFTHPSKPKEPDYRNLAWNYGYVARLAGQQLECLPNDGPWRIDGSDETFEYFRKAYPHAGPQLYLTWDWVGSGIPEYQSKAYTGEWLGDQTITVNNNPIDKKGLYGQPWVQPGTGNPGIRVGLPSTADYFTWHLERMIRLGKVPGWWWDHTWPPPRVETVAAGGAYFRDPDDVKDGELPWQAGFGSIPVQRMFKRLARLTQKHGVPQYNAFWASSGTAFESYGRRVFLTESAGSGSTYDTDHVVLYPLSHVRFMSAGNKGLTAWLLPLITGLKGSNLMPGMDRRMDRTVMMRALLHDIGVMEAFPNPDEVDRTLNILLDFGYFDEANTEMIPYWRSRRYARYGTEFESESEFMAHEENPYKDVHITIYRRPFRRHGNRQGYQALFVIANESDRPVNERLFILDAQRLLGGQNNLTVADIFGARQAGMRHQISRRLVSGFHAGRKALHDLERDGAVTQATRGAARSPVGRETYGELFIAARDYALVLAQYDPSPEAERFDRRTVAAETARRSALRRAAFDTSERPWWDVWQELTPRLEALDRE